MKNKGQYSFYVKLHGFTLTLMILFLGSISLQAQKFNKLIWSDEFNGTGGPDSTKWSYELGGGGWGNKELQYYTRDNKNAYLSDGNLVIKAIKEDINEYHYSSARIITKGKFEVKYGRLEVRAMIPIALGTWPTFWMMESNRDKVRWPTCGEVDILENFGYDSLKMRGTIHRGENISRKHISSGNTIQIENSSKVFHVYAIEWDSTKIDFFVDKIKYHTYEKTPDTIVGWPFDQPSYLLLNLAIGGCDGGLGVDDSRFPHKFQIDYIRVYQ